MRAQKLFGRWQGRRAKLLAQLTNLQRRCRRAGDAEQVHQFRVTLRRLRLLARIGRPLFDPAAIASLRRWGKRVSLLTSRARDLDVASEWLQEQAQGEEAVEIIEARRDRLWQASRPRLTTLPPLAAKGLRKAKVGRKAQERLQRRFLKFETRLAGLIAAQDESFFDLPVARQHAFRRAVRWWRYLREAALSPEQQKDDALVPRLMRVQEALGELQNRAVTGALLSRLKLSASKAELLRTLARQQSWCQAEVQRTLQELAQVRFRPVTKA
jgi:CHAD domain-containing protein